eukprot:6723721-Alexandrium_andersonii.AAC.1
MTRWSGQGRRPRRSRTHGRSWKGPLKGPERLKGRSRSSRAKQGVSGRSSPLASRWRVVRQSLS